MKYNLMLLVVSMVSQAPHSYGRILTGLSRVAVRPMTSLSNEEQPKSSHVIQGRQTQGLPPAHSLERSHGGNINAKAGFFKGPGAKKKSVLAEESFKQFMLRMSRMKQSNDLFARGAQKKKQQAMDKTMGPSALVLQPLLAGAQGGQTPDRSRGVATKKFLKKYGAQWKKKWEGPKGKNFKDK